MIDIKYSNPEELRQMNIHKWLVSEKCGRDVGEEAFFDWIQRYARLFRSWANTLPENCINCGLQCNKDGNNKCINPFNPKRLEHLNN